MSDMGDAYLAIVPKLDDSAMQSAMSGITEAAVAKGTVIGNAVSGMLEKVSSAALSVTKTVVSGAVEQYASYEQNVGGIQKLFGNMGQSVEQYAAANNQSVEEASGAWQSLEDAQNLVIRNASNAFETCGVSANTYMETVTSFSASLISSLGGDTEAAAQQAQVAMVAMSDNVNTFGTDMQDVQNAYQGFAKQNYTMLDNLKLGYGGTQAEMERLIQDANDFAAANGEAADLSIDSFSDIVTAIELIQEKQNIAGTTSREAATTIEGSVNQMKAAWENWLTVLGEGDETRVMEATDDLISSVESALDNVLPVVQRVFESVSEAMPELMEELEPTISQIVEEWGPPIAAAAANALATVFGVLGENMPDLLTILGTLLNSLIDELILNPLTSLGETIWSAVSEWWDGVATGIGEWFSNLGTTVNDAGTSLGESINQWLEGVVTAIAEWVAGVAQQALDAGSQFLTNVGTFLSQLPGNVAGFLSSVISNVASWVSEMVSDAQQAGSSFLDGIVSFFTQLPGNVSNFLSGAIDAIASFVGDCLSNAQQAGQNFLNGVSEGFNSAVDFVRGIPDSILSALGNVGSLLWNAGSSIINGLRDGIVSAAQGVYDYVSGIADKIAALKGPLPYDRKVLIPNGEALMESLNAGLVGGFRDVEDTVGSMAGKLADDLDLGGVSAGVEVAANASIARASAGARTSQAREGAVVDLSRVVGLLERIAEGGDVYLDGNAISSGLYSRSRTSMRGRGYAVA